MGAENGGGGMATRVKEEGAFVQLRMPRNARGRGWGGEKEEEQQQVMTAEWAGVVSTWSRTELRYLGECRACA